MVWVRKESFKKTFDCHGTEVVAEVNRAGELMLHGYDFDFDQSLIEFGEGKTNCYQMHRRWADLPAMVIVDYFEVPVFTLVNLALDWADHVSWLCYSPKWSREHIEMARELVTIEWDIFNNVATERQRQRGIQLSIGLSMKSTSYIGDSSGRTADSAASSAVRAVMELSSRGGYGGYELGAATFENAGACAKAADRAYKAKIGRGGRGLRERIWQVRRFIDVMPGREHGFIAPPLKWTK